MTTTQSIEESNNIIRAAIKTRMTNVAAGKSHEQWYDPIDAAEGALPVAEPEAADDTVTKPLAALAPPPVPPATPQSPKAAIKAACRPRPGSLAFMEVLEEIREMHLKKSQDYGEPVDALANIRFGAEVVGVEPWRGCVIRIADKMQRIRSYCRDGKLANESFEDALSDLASYAIIALVMFREQKNREQS